MYSVILWDIINIILYIILVSSVQSQGKCLSSHITLKYHLHKGSRNSIHSYTFNDSTTTPCNVSYVKKNLS